jgi:phage terminase large subunit-like protein
MALVFSKTQADSSLLAQRVLRQLGAIGLKLDIENLSHIKIRGGGEILFRNSKPDSARGIESVVHVLIDECAFIQDAKEIYAALAPCMMMSGSKARVYIVSTPNGKNDDLYWQMVSSGNGDRDIESICAQVAKGESDPFQYWIDESGWGKVIVHWKAHPIYGSQPDFLEKIQREQKLSSEVIQREYELNFSESESNYYEFALVRNCIAEIDYEYDKDAFYFFGVDASTVGEDYAVCAVLKLKDNKYSLVDFYRKRKETSEYHLYHISKLIEKYKPSRVAVEVTGGTGQVWFESLQKSHWTIKFDRINTTAESKPAMLDRLKLMMESERFYYAQNSLIIDELLNFRRTENNKLQASSGKHDDVIMAVSFAITSALQWE